MMSHRRPQAFTKILKNMISKALSIDRQRESVQGASWKARNTNSNSKDNPLFLRGGGKENKYYPGFPQIFGRLNSQKLNLYSPEYPAKVRGLRGTSYRVSLAKLGKGVSKAKA